MSTLDVPEDDSQRIERAIASDSSPVGIDAKKTHVIIIQMLEKIEKKLVDLESRLDRLETR